MIDQTEHVPAPRRSRRWLVPAAIVALAIVAQVIGRQLVDEDVSMQSVVGVLTWLSAFLLVGIWWLFFSGLRWKLRLAGIAAFVGSVAVFLALFRFEGQGGNFIPQFRFRFTESAEERALAYFANAEKPEPPADAVPSEAPSLPITNEDWPKFGGIQGDSIVRGQSIRSDWESNPPEPLWRHPVGPGWSSFAVVGDFAFTQEQRGEEECVVCYDAGTGEPIWTHQDTARFEESAGGPGPRATPTLHDGRLYALGATGVLNCLDPRTGTLHWTTNVVDDNGGKLLEWAASGSPVIHEDHVLVNPGTSTSFLAAYDRLTGEQRWSGPEGRAGYATPVIATIGDTPQVVIYRAGGVSGHSLSNGEQWWFFEWTNATKINVAQPLVLPDESVFISSGYGGGSALLEVLHDGQTWSVNSKWERPNKFKLKFNGGIYKEGHVYGLDEGILSCFEMQAGKRTWKRGRYKFGQILMIGDQVLVLTEDGEVVLVNATAESMSEEARFKAIDGKTWNHPVLNRGRLFVRNGSEAACYDLRPEISE